jgi:hypothetical protein
MLIFRRIFLSNNWWQESDIWSQASYRYVILWEAFLDHEKWAYMFNVYKNQLSRQTGSGNLMGPKMLPTIWGTYMTLVTKYQISVINSCWEKCDEKCGLTMTKLLIFYTYFFYSPASRRQRSDIWSQASYRYPISCFTSVRLSVLPIQVFIHLTEYFIFISRVWIRRQ